MKKELNPEVQKRVRTYFRQLNMLFGTFFSGIVLFLISAIVVMMGLEQGMDPDLGGIMIYCAPISGGALILLSYRFFRSRVKHAQTGEKLHQKMDGYRGALVIRMILIDGAAFIQLIAYLLIGSSLYLWLSVAVISIFFMTKPSLNKFVSDLELNEVEEAVMRDHYEKPL